MGWKDNPKEPGYGPWAYSPMAQTLLRFLGAKVNPVAEDIVSDPIYFGLKKIGVGQQLPVSEEAKYSPTSLMVQKLSDIKSENIDERIPLSLALGYGGLKAIGTVGSAVKLASDISKIKEVELGTRAGITQDVLNAGGWTNAADSLTEKLLELRSKMGAITHPEAVPEAEKVVHKISNEIQVKLGEEYKRQVAKTALEKTQAGIADKINKLRKMLPETQYGTAAEKYFGLGGE